QCEEDSLGSSESGWHSGPLGLLLAVTSTPVWTAFWGKRRAALREKAAREFVIVSLASGGTVSVNLRRWARRASATRIVGNRRLASQKRASCCWGVAFRVGCAHASVPMTTPYVRRTRSRRFVW